MKPAYDPRDESELRAGLSAHVSESFRPIILLGWILSLIFALGLGGLAWIQVMPPFAALTSLGIALVFGTLHWFLARRQWQLPPSWVNPLAACFVLLSFWGVLSFASNVPQPEIGWSLFFIIILLTASIFISTRWYVGLICFLTVSWLSYLLFARLTTNWMAHLFESLCALVLATVIHVARRKTAWRLQIAHLHDTRAKAELAETAAVLKQRNDALNALYDTSLGIVDRLSLADLLQAIVARAIQILHTEHGFVSLVNPLTQTIEIKLGLGDHQSDIGVQLIKGEGVAGKVWQTGHEVIVEDYSQWAGRSSQFKRDRTHALVGLPLKAGGEVVGVLGVSYHEPGRLFLPAEIELLQKFAQIASIALYNAQLYTSAQLEIVQRMETAEQLSHELAEKRRAEEALAKTNTQLEQALLNANELALAAEAASRAKSNFLANMSHELRTPLTAILGLSELMLNLSLEPDLQNYVSRIYSSGEILLKLLNDLLDLSQIEAGQFELDWQEFDLQLLMHRVISAFAPLAEEKSLKFTHTIDDAVPNLLTGDPSRLRQALLNLLSNALKFTEQGQIDLEVKLQTLTSEEAWLVFTVRDTGIGVPPDKHNVIFEPFTQADSSMTRRYGGSGLGLAIVRHLVDKFGGRCWMESTPASGSSFHFNARFGVKPPTPAGAKHDTAPLRELTPRPFNILVAEDNPMNRQLVSRMLQKRGWQVTLAEEGVRAVQLALETYYDLILMDVQMPQLDGLAATAAIRASERETARHTPIVAFTAYAMMGDREKCLAAGMDGYLTKPVRARELYDTVEQFARKNY